ncbi:hypothetical protein [Candidatus Tisiphia endosymbiont of Nemotelus uliginosus]|uniref:hypothetical protein n=1 Tax=Candidatus Tisiphia endosymbiont of Nemotelus uliginosus TaxID=3077926 RepID=UPI0035C8D18F
MSGDEKRYIESEERTANSLFKYCARMLKDAITTDRFSKSKEESIEFHRMMYSLLQESLLFGKAEAALGMSVAWTEFATLEGHVTPDEREKKRRLLMAVAIELCDETEVEEKARFKDSISAKALEDAEKEAKKWVKGIHKNTKHYKDSKNIVITANKLHTAHTKFNKIVPGQLMLDPLVATRVDHKVDNATAATLRNHLSAASGSGSGLGFSNPPTSHAKPPHTPVSSKSVSKSIGRKV